MGAEILVLPFPRSPNIGVFHLLVGVDSGSLDEKRDANPLLDVKDVLVRATVRSSFFAVCIPVQVQDVDLVEPLHQPLAHSSESGIIDVGVISYEPYDSSARALDLPLRPANEFHIVVLEPFCLRRLREFGNILRVPPYKPANPFALVC